MCVFTRARACVLTDRLTNDYVRSFFYRFYPNFACPGECGRFDACCLRDKPEIDCGFYRCANSNFGSFPIVVAAFSRIVTKIRKELKLMSTDFVVGGHRNRKLNSDREAKHPISVSISSFIRTNTYAILY